MRLFSRNPNALWTELDAQFLLMDIESGAYFSATGIGGEIWHLLDAPRSEAEIVDHIIDRYEVDRETCARDVGAYLDRLAAVNMVSREPEVAGPAE